MDAAQTTGGPESEIEFKLLTQQDNIPGWNKSLAVVFMLQGGGWLQIEGSRTDYALRPRDIFVINSFQLYSVSLEENALALALFIPPAFMAAFSPETMSPTFNCKSFLHSTDRQPPFDMLRKDFAHIFRARYKNESSLPAHLRSKTAALLDTLFMHFLESEKAEQDWSGRERMRTAVDYIHRHYRENITLAALSTQAYLSKSYISRSFQKHFGVTFTGYLTEVRLLHAAGLLRGDATITDIAYESGFSSANSMIEAFKQYRGLTPGQYRQKLRQSRSAPEKQPNQDEEGFSTAFASLLHYLNQDPISVGKNIRVETFETSVDVNSIKRSADSSWKRLINSGYARDLLNGSMQKQMIRLQHAVGFEYIRCKGLLDDDMVLFSKDLYGNTEINYVYADEVIDFILSVGAKPLLELSHMPCTLAKQNMMVFRRPTVISAPADMELWGSLIEGLMSHWIARYGMRQMQGWLFAPWTSPDFSQFGLLDLEEYTAAYLASYRAIKKACPHFRICGPGCTVHNTNVFSWFLDMCQDNGCLPDILTFRSFAAMDPTIEPDALQLTQSNEVFPLAVSGDENYLSSAREAILGVTRQKGVAHLPVMLEEWSNNIWQRDLCNDTSYKSAYIFKSVLENAHLYDAMGYFSLGDQLDEIAPAPGAFHGGFGIFTRGGLAKSAYRAFQLLSRQGNVLLMSGEGCCVTASEDEIQIYLYNYSHYDTLYRYRHSTNLTKTERYKVFNEKQPASHHICLMGLAPGEHIIRRYSIGPEGGSSYDAWLTMGAPEKMTPEEEKLLEHLSHPTYKTERVQTEDRLHLNAHLIPHEVQLITVSR